MTFQSDAFQNNAFQLVPGAISGTVAIVISPVLTASIVGAVKVQGSVAATIAPAFIASVTGAVKVAGSLGAVLSPGLTASITGTSDGTVIVIPRDVSGGIEYLVEMGAYDSVASVETILRFSTQGFNTLPSDSVPNAHYGPYVKNPGDYTRSFFSDGKTAGAIDVGVGTIDLVNKDGSLDYLFDKAFDGRQVLIKAIDRLNPLYVNAITVFRGVMEQPEFTWAKVSIRIRDRLAELDQKIQPVLFAGTTIAGGMNEAEGTADGLKDQPKPLTYGAVPMVAAVASNTFDKIFDLGADGLSGVAKVWDKGVEVAPTGTNYTSVSGLRTASVPPGQYSTYLAKGLIRTGSAPQGTLAAAPIEGGSGQRTAAQIARRMLLKMGKVEGVDFLSSDVTAVDTLNNSEIGYWIGTEEVTALDAIGKVLGSIGAALVPDKLGVMRMYRLQEPAARTGVVLTKAELLENTAGYGIERLITGDEGNGIPAWKVTLNYGHNWQVMSRNELDPVNATDAFKAFAQEEWRTAVASDDAVKAIHKLASELTFDTYLTQTAAAQAEAARRLALYKARRDRLRIPVKNYVIEQVDIGSTVRLQINRFGLDAGKNFLVIGMSPNLQTKNTALDLWG